MTSHESEKGQINIFCVIRFVRWGKVYGEYKQIIIDIEVEQQTLICKLIKR